MKRDSEQAEIFLKQLASGADSTVFLIRFEKDQESHPAFYAMRHPNNAYLDRDDNEEDRVRILNNHRAVERIRRISNPYIENNALYSFQKQLAFKFYGQSGTPSFQIELLPAAVAGSLELNAFSHAELSWIIFNMSQNLNFLHSHLIVHRDIKPQNFLLNDDGSVTMIDLDTIADFSAGEKIKYSGRLGTPSFMSPPEVFALSREAETEENILQSFGPRCGQGRFPENLYEIIDHWSLGLSIYQLYIGGLPHILPNERSDHAYFVGFEGESSDVSELSLKFVFGNEDKKISINFFPELLALHESNPHAFQLIVELLTYDRSQRLINCQQIKDHPYFEEQRLAILEGATAKAQYQGSDLAEKLATEFLDDLQASQEEMAEELERIKAELMTEREDLDYLFDTGGGNKVSAARDRLIQIKILESRREHLFIEESIEASEIPSEQEMLDYYQDSRNKTFIDEQVQKYQEKYLMRKKSQLIQRHRVLQEYLLLINKKIELIQTDSEHAISRFKTFKRDYYQNKQAYEKQLHRTIAEQASGQMLDEFGRIHDKFVDQPLMIRIPAFSDNWSSDEQSSMSESDTSSDSGHDSRSSNGLLSNYSSSNRENQQTHKVSWFGRIKQIIKNNPYKTAIITAGVGAVVVGVVVTLATGGMAGPVGVVLVSVGAGAIAGAGTAAGTAFFAGGIGVIAAAAVGIGSSPFAIFARYRAGRSALVKATSTSTSSTSTSTNVSSVPIKKEKPAMAQRNKLTKEPVLPTVESRISEIEQSLNQLGNVRRQAHNAGDLVNGSTSGVTHIGAEQLHQATNDASAEVDSQAENTNHVS